MHQYEIVGYYFNSQPLFETVYLKVEQCLSSWKKYVCLLAFLPFSKLCGCIELAYNVNTHIKLHCCAVSIGFYLFIPHSFVCLFHFCLITIHCSMGYRFIKTIGMFILPNNKNIAKYLSAAQIKLHIFHGLQILTYKQTLSLQKVPKYKERWTSHWKKELDEWKVACGEDVLFLLNSQRRFE